MRPHDEQVDTLALAATVRSLVLSAADAGARRVTASSLLALADEVMSDGRWGDALVVYREVVLLLEGETEFALREFSGRASLRMALILMHSDPRMALRVCEGVVGDFDGDLRLRYLARRAQGRMKEIREDYL